MMYEFNEQGHPPISTTMEQMSLLSTNNTPSREKGKQITINSTSPVQEIKQHAESNIQVRPGGTIVITPPNPCKLPNEILELIFSYTTNSPSTLYACTLANKQCYHVATPMLWKTHAFLDPIRTNRFLDGMVAMTDQRRSTLGRLIHDLRLIHLYYNDKRVPQLLPYMPNLQHLTLGRSDSNAIQQLSSRLTSLKLDRGFVTESDFGILAQCPLEVFDWDLELSQSPNWLIHLGRCPLRRLSIHRQDTGINSPYRNRYIAANMARLPKTPFASFITNPSTFPQLTYLSISRIPDINDFVLTAFFKNHPLLEQLHLSQQDDVSDATLLAMDLPHLKRASLTHLENITAPVVSRLIYTCPLTYLDVSGCIQVVPSEFPELSVAWMGVLNSSDLDKIRAPE